MCHWLFRQWRWRKVFRKATRHEMKNHGNFHLFWVWILERDEEKYVLSHSCTVSTRHVVMLPSKVLLFFINIFRLAWHKWPIRTASDSWQITASTDEWEQDPCWRYQVVTHIKARTNVNPTLGNCIMMKQMLCWSESYCYCEMVTLPASLARAWKLSLNDAVADNSSTKKKGSV